MDTLPGSVRPADLADFMLSRGYSSATTSEVSHVLGVSPDLVRVRLHPYVKRGEWVSPARGLWVPVPPQYRLWGAPEGIEIVDDTMRHLGVDYYVGWLTAASIHGSAHHAPQVFQAAVTRYVANRRVGRTDFQFYTRRAVKSLPTVPRNTTSGTARVSTPEVTILDLAADLTLAGGLDNAATTIVGLVEPGIDMRSLATLSEQFPAAAARRVGWILDAIGNHAGLRPLLDVVAKRHEDTSFLDPTGPRAGAVDMRWSLNLNATVDAEF